MEQLLNAKAFRKEKTSVFEKRNILKTIIIWLTEVKFQGKYFDARNICQHFGGTTK